MGVGLSQSGHGFARALYTRVYYNPPPRNPGSATIVVFFDYLTKWPEALSYQISWLRRLSNSCVNRSSADMVSNYYQREE